MLQLHHEVCFSSSDYLSCYMYRSAGYNVLADLNPGFWTMLVYRDLQLQDWKFLFVIQINYTSSLASIDDVIPAYFNLTISTCLTGLQITIESNNKKLV